MTRYIFFFMALALLSACGGQQQKTAGIAEETMLIVRGEQLVGLTVSVGGQFRKTLSSSDLTAYELGVLGAKDGENERLQTVTLKVDEGEQKVTVSDGKVMLVDRSMYFSKGQTRELRIRQ